MDPNKWLLVAALAWTVGSEVVGAESGVSTPIQLSSGVVDTTGSPPAAAWVAAPHDEALLVQFPGPVTRENLAALAQAGLQIYTYLPDHAFLVRMPAGERAARLEGLGARWVGPWSAELKVGQATWQRVATARDDERLSLMVQIFPERELAPLLATLQSYGVAPVGMARGSFFSRLRLLLSPPEIARLAPILAQDPAVFFLETEPRRALLNDTTIWVGQSGLGGGGATPLFDRGLLGQGQTVAVLDTGIDPDLCFFRDTNLGLPPTNCQGGTTFDAAQRKVRAVNFLFANDCNGGIGNNEWDTQDHGSHVAGTVAGDNFANLLDHDSGDGMAPAAQLVIQDGGYQVDNCGDLPGIGCPVVDLNPIFQQTYDQGARIHTNSWGDNENAAVQNNYSAGSQDVDEFSWNHKDFLILFAAGNAGNTAGKVSSPSTAKSAISVGATQRAANANAIASFSSCGYTDDGRIKPEITVPGVSIISADNDGLANTNNCGVRSNSGTSMATPGAAGLAALIRQYFTDGFYPGGVATPTNTLDPSAALIRATLINSGENMTGTAVMPANCQGWGRVLLDNALYFPGDPRRLWVEDDPTGFAAGAADETLSYPVHVADDVPLKLTLAWTDYPSTPAANPHLVNDLDLELLAPNGDLYRGNVWSGGQSVTGGNADRRNTLEQILVAAPAPGLWQITVRAVQIPSGPQPFALVVTGAADASVLFADGFESGDTTSWATSTHGAGGG